MSDKTIPQCIGEHTSYQLLAQLRKPKGLINEFLINKNQVFSVFSSNEVLKPFYAWYDDDYFRKPETSSKRSDQGFFQGMGRSCFSCIIILDVFNTLYIVLVLKKVVKNPATSRILQKNPAGTGFLKNGRSGAGLSGGPEFRYTPSHNEIGSYSTLDMQNTCLW